MFGFPKSTQHLFMLKCLALSGFLCPQRSFWNSNVQTKKHKALVVIHVILKSICATPVWNSYQFCSINSSIGIVDADFQLKTISPKGTCFDLLLFARNVQDNPPSQKLSWRVFLLTDQHLVTKRQWPHQRSPKRLKCLNFIIASTLMSKMEFS